MKVLVLGSGGMAGHIVATYLRENGYSVDTLSAKNKLDNKTVLLDVTDTPTFISYLGKKRYDVVVNCIGLLIKPSEERKDLAVALNSYLPHFLEAYYKNSKTKIIHLSTDCVFSGKSSPYNETSWYDGELFYDRSKALGEIINNKDLTFRMSIIGPDMQKDGVGLFNWFYAQSGNINGYTKAIWNGVTTIELAHAIEEAIKQDLTGLYHLAPDKSISKYNLLRLFAEVFNKKDIIITPSDNMSFDKTLLNTRTDFKFYIPDYKKMITEMKEWVDQHRDLYHHYEK